MKNLYDCNESFNRGEQGEEIVFKWMQSMPKVKAVKDVRKDPYYRSVDVDFLVKDTDDRVGMVEVKTDFYTTGRLCYEVMSCVELQTPGCMRKSKANILLYYVINQDKLYSFTFENFRNWCEENLETKGIKFDTITSTKRSNNKSYTTDNRYFNFSELEKHSFCRVYENISKNEKN